MSFVLSGVQLLMNAFIKGYLKVQSKPATQSPAETGKAVKRNCFYPPVAFPFESNDLYRGPGFDLDIRIHRCAFIRYNLFSHHILLVSGFVATRHQKPKQLGAAISLDGRLSQ